MNLNPIASSTSEVISSVPMSISSVVLVGGTANSSVEISDSTDGNSNIKIELKVLANDSKPFYFDGHIDFSKVYSKIAGSGAKVYIYNT